MRESLKLAGFLLLMALVAMALPMIARAATVPNAERCLDYKAYDAKDLRGRPCPPFTNRPKVIQRVKEMLIYNGFRPAMKFYDVSPRQFRFGAYQDGVYCIVTVVKTAPRTILVRADWPDVRKTQLKTMSLKFDA